MTAVARTPLHHWHVEHGARLADNDGWQVAAVYSAVEREIAAARAGLGLADLSAFAKVSVLGKGVAALTRALRGEAPELKPLDVAALTAPVSALACRLTEEQLLLLANTTQAKPLDDQLTALTQGHLAVSADVTSAYAGFALVGPHIDELLAQLSSLDVLPAGSCAETNLAGVQALLARPPEQALPEVRVHVSWDLGEFVWERLLETGRGLGIVPLGLDAWRRLRS